MAREVHGMVEKRGAGLWLTHVFMIIGILIIFFPIWLAFVASTVTQDSIRIFTVTTTTDNPDPGAPAQGTFVVSGEVVMEGGVGTDACCVSCMHCRQ